MAADSLHHNDYDVKWRYGGGSRCVDLARSAPRTRNVQLGALTWRCAHWAAMHRRTEHPLPGPHRRPGGAAYHPEGLRIVPADRCVVLRGRARCTVPAMPIAEARQPVPGMVAGLAPNSVAPPDPAESASDLAPPADQAAPPAADQAVRLAPPPAAAPRAPATPERWAEPDGAAPVHPAPVGPAAGAAPPSPDEQGAPLPEPVALRVERAEVVPDLTLLAAEALRWLAAHEPATLTDWLSEGRGPRRAAASPRWSPRGPGTAPPGTAASPSSCATLACSTWSGGTRSASSHGPPCTRCQEQPGGSRHS